MSSAVSFSLDSENMTQYNILLGFWAALSLTWKLRSP